MNRWEAKYFKKYDQKLFMPKEEKDEINSLKKIILDDLCYVCLALIQQTSFEAIEERSHLHFYPRQFLQGIIAAQDHLLKNTPKDDYLNKALRVKKEGLNSMLGVLSCKENNANAIIINLVN